MGDCNQVGDWIQNEHAQRSLFSLSWSGWPTLSAIANMRHKEKILCFGLIYLFFFPLTQGLGFLSDKIWQNQLALLT